ncbi:MAG: hypothetical protein R6W76_02705 [Caldilinea sp.]
MSETFQRFNLNTMSGVFPGTRTMVYQRVRLAPISTSLSDAPMAEVTDDAPAPIQWARVLWYDDPPSCVVELEARGAGSAANTLDEQERRVVRIPDPDQATLAQLLSDALAVAGWRLMACGTCAFWQPVAARTADGLATGRCCWRSEAENVASPLLHSSLIAQSLLALACTHWRDAAKQSPASTAEDDNAPLDAIAPFRKRAEQESDERWTLIGQFRRWLRRSAPPAPDVSTQTWEDRIVERSGVGAGAEPCFACQGRIANLGALVAATPEGDKRTFSVWRCRTCHTYYLNDWIDRWERTESLETEERYYRLTPSEAMEVLAVIDNVVHAEHPARRHERTAQRDWMLAFVGERSLLSHQVRQGR